MLNWLITRIINTIVGKLELPVSREFKTVNEINRVPWNNGFSREGFLSILLHFTTCREK